ncbi:MAG TPA: hypothetical protein VFI17_08525 [Solirubrobacterales bacterium]|nr:hypothetical protein [Solirubrobacterales bacterium]
MSESCISVAVPNGVEPDSWLNGPDYRSFRSAYVYASKQTRAIPALAKCSAEEVHGLFEALKHGELYYETAMFKLDREAREEYEETAIALLGETFREEKPRIDDDDPCEITLTERIPFWGYRADRSDGGPWQLTDSALMDDYELAEVAG